MDKINAQLENEINARPFDEFEVIITLKEGSNPDTIRLEDYKTISDTILAAKVKAANIKILAKNKNVSSIELDSEMGIM